jgi:hypothetical protein
MEIKSSSRLPCRQLKSGSRSLESLWWLFSSVFLSGIPSDFARFWDWIFGHSLDIAIA